MSRLQRKLKKFRRKYKALIERDDRRRSPDFRQARRFLSPEIAGEVEILIDELGLIFINVEKVEETE